MSWADERVSDSEPGLADEDVAEVAAEQSDVNALLRAGLPDLAAAHEGHRRRYRRWAERLTGLSPSLGAPGRMLVVRLLLWTSAAGAWDHDDRSWVTLVADALWSLGAAALPPEVEPLVASLAAVALSVLRAESGRSVHSQTSLRSNRGWASVDHSDGLPPTG